MQILGSGTAAEVYIFNRATVVCDDGLVIRSDSAVIFPAQRLSRLFGRVSFDEGGRVLTADRADYYSGDERLQAWGTVALEDSAQGSRMEGEQLDYLRASDTRPEQRITMTGPSVSATVVPRARQTPTAPVQPSLQVADTLGPMIDLDSLAGFTAEVPPAEREVSIPIWIPLPAGAVWRTSIRVTLPADSPPVLPATPPTQPPATGESLPPDPMQESDPGPPYHVTASRRITIHGENTFEAEGDVEVEREGLLAYGDRMRFDEALGELHLVGRAMTEGEGYELSGQALSLVMDGQSVSEVVARDEAILSTSEIDVRAQRIRLFVADSTLDRLSAGLLGPADTVPVVGSGGADGVLAWIQISPDPMDSTRADAVAEDFRLTADSLDVWTPGEVLDRVTAIGRARGDAFSGDSVDAENTPEVAHNDWLEGDTIVAVFVEDTLARSTDVEKRGGYNLEELLARGSARSLYRLQPSDSTQAQPGRLALHYVVGDSIRISMVDGAVDRMEVRGQTQGIHLEPLPPSDSAAADTLGADTLGVDSTTVPPDTVMEVGGDDSRPQEPRKNDLGQPVAASRSGREGV